MRVNGLTRGFFILIVLIVTVAFLTFSHPIIQPFYGQQFWR
jgi:hypothetical protein